MEKGKKKGVKPDPAEFDVEDRFPLVMVGVGRGKMKTKTKNGTRHAVW